MRKLLFFLISILIGFGLLFWIIKIVGWEEIKLAFLTFSGWHGLIILILTISTLAIGNWRWKEILKHQGNNISFFSLFRVYLAAFSIMFFTPIVMLGGETFRSYILRKKYSISWNKGIASVFADRIIEITIYLIIILIGVIFLFSSRGLPSGYSAIILGAVLIFLITGISFFYFKTFKKQSIIKFFGRFFNPKLIDEEPFEVEKEIFGLLKPKKAFFWKIIGLSCLKCVLAITRVWFLILFLGRRLSFLSTMSVLGFSYLAAMIPIPTALGVHEAFQTFVFNSLGLEESFAPVFTMIIRGVELLISLIGVFILFRLGAGLLRSILLRKIENLVNNKNNHR